MAPPRTARVSFSDGPSPSVSLASDRPWQSRSDSGIGSDLPSPPERRESISLNEAPLATQQSASGQSVVPHGSVQPQPDSPPHDTPAVLGEGIELSDLSRRNTTSTTGAQSRRDRQSVRSSSSTKTSSSWLTFITGTVTDSLGIPEGYLGWTVLVLHYVIFFLYSILQTTLNYLNLQAANSPNSAEVTIAKMQKLFGETAHADAIQAHKDTERLLDALTSKANADAKWEVMFNKFIEIVDACVGQTNQNATSTRCAQAFASAQLNESHYGAPTVAPSEALQKRKLDEIKAVFDDHEAKIRSLSLSPWQRLLPAQFGVLLVVAMTAIVISSICLWYLYKWVPPLLARLWKRRQFHGKGDFDEKFDEVGLTADESYAIATGVVDVEGNQPIRRRAIPDARHLPDNAWEIAAQGRLSDLKRVRAEKPELDIEEIHPHYGTVLAAAARSGNPGTVSYLLGERANVHAEGGRYHNVLQSGACSGSLSVVKILIEAGARDTSIGGYYGTALNAAAEKGDVEMLKLLLQHATHPERSVNVSGGLHEKALIAAASRGQLDMVKELIKHGAKVNECSASGESALIAATVSGHGDVVEVLIKRNADVDALSSALGTALHAACRSKASTIAMLLIQNNASLTIKDQNSRTALHEASKCGLTDVVRAILEKDDSCVNFHDGDENTALHHASIGGHAEIASLVIKHGIDVSKGDKFQAQALFRAAGCHHADVVHVLLHQGHADVHALDCFDQTALHGPARSDDVRVQQMLLDFGGNPNARGAFNRTPLHEACNMGRYENVKLLLSQPDIDINVINNDQITPLCNALCSTNDDYKNQCIDPRIPIMMLDHLSLPIRQPAIHTNNKNLKPDTRAPVDINLCNGQAIQEAARKSLLDVLRKMLDDHNANIHITGGKYGGALQAAAISGDIEVLNLLLSHRANPNAQGGEFGSPLAAACAYGNLAAVKLLLESGADASVKGVGRWGSAWESTCMKLEEGWEGRHKIEYLRGEVRGVLKRWGGEVGVTRGEMVHLGDSWTLMTSGWDWSGAGVL